MSYFLNQNQQAIKEASSLSNSEIPQKHLIKKSKIIYILAFIFFSISGMNDDKYPIHTFVKKIEKNQFTDEKKHELASLIEKNANINAFNSENLTPLAAYIDNNLNTKKPFDISLYNELFSHGALIFCKKKSFSCNPLFLIIKYSGYHPHNKSIAIGELFKAQLKPLKKAYINRLLIFKALNAMRFKNKLYKIPNPLIYLIINFAHEQEEIMINIKGSLQNKQLVTRYCILNINDSFNTTYAKKELATPLEAAKSVDMHHNYDDLYILINDVFYNRPFKNILEDLDSCIDNAHKAIKKKENDPIEIRKNLRIIW